MAVPLRADFDARMTRAAAKRSKNGAQARRLLALAAIYDGAARTQAAEIGGVTRQIVRDWVVKFNAHGPDGLIDGNQSGRPSRLSILATASAGSRIRFRRSFRPYDKNCLLTGRTIRFPPEAERWAFTAEESIRTSVGGPPAWASA